MEPKKWSLSTYCVAPHVAGTATLQGARLADFGGLSVAIHPSSTYKVESAEQGALLAKRKGWPELPENGAMTKDEFFYSRWRNPTVAAVAAHLASLEQAKGCLLFSTGMAAISTCILTAVKAGDHIISQSSVYGGTFHLFSHYLKENFGVQVTFVNVDELNDVEKYVRPNTKLIYVESPSNPTLRLVDLERIAAIGKKHSILTIIDSTLGTPVNQQPLKWGIDVVLHSATKFLSGHSDLTAGALLSNSQEFLKQVLSLQQTLGSTLSPFDAFLLARGLKTLHLRVSHQNNAALRIARFLDSHPKVKTVHYPGLPSHKDFQLAQRQMPNGFGGLLSFELHGGKEDGRKVIEHLQVINLAVSLGSVESLVEQAATMTHSQLNKEELSEAGIEESLIRLSVGIEDVDDLIEDLRQALDFV
jgi:methionine-gamma-lyase